MSGKTHKLTTRLLIGLIGLFLVFVAIHFAGIGVLRYLAEKELHPALPRGTQIEKVHLSLLSGSLEVQGFELRNEDERRISAERMIVDIDPWRLLFGEVHVQRAALDHVRLRLDRRPDGSFDLGLPPFGATAAPASEPSEPIAFSIDRVNLRKVTIDFHDGEKQSDLEIARLNVGEYSLLAESQEVPIEWVMFWEGRRVAGEAVAVIEGDDVGARGRIETELLDLGRGERLARLGSTLEGEVALQGEFEWQAPRLTLRGDLQSPQLRYQIAGRRVALTAVDIPGFALELSTAPEFQLQLSAGAGTRIATMDNELEGHHVTAEDVVATGTLVIDQAALVGRDLDYSAASVGWASGAQRVAVTGLGLRGQIQQSLRGDTPFPGANAHVVADTLGFSDEDAALQVEVAGLGIEDFALSQLDDAGARQLGGRLVTAASRVAQHDTTLAWSSVEATIGGRLHPQRVHLQSDLAVGGISVANPVFPAGPLTLQRLAAAGLDVGEQTRFERLRFEGLQIPAQPEETALDVAAIEVNDGEFADARGVGLGKIVIDGLQTAVIRDANGQWRYPMSRPASPDDAPTAGEVATDPAADTTAAADEAGAPLAWRIGGLEVTGDSYLAVADHLNPDMQAPRFHIAKLEVGALDSAAPQQDTPFAVLLRPDEYSEFVIDGVVRPLGEHLFLEAEGHLHGFAMQAFNGLVANDLGHRFLDGQLDNDFKIKLDTNKLDMSNGLELASLEVEEIPDKEGPPLATAIALLENRDGNIKLDVPVSGDLSDPKFRVLGALNPIIMKAVAGTAALAIQPLGSVLLVGGLLADQALKVTFEPALFEPGDVGLNAAGQKYLKQLAGKLKEKPKLALKFCGVSVQAERKKDDKGKFLDQEADMLALAQRRADAARAFLSSQGVGKQQMRACRPAYDDTPDARPRVDIRF